MKIIFSEKCLEYSWPGHIERPERIRKALGLLRRKYEFVEPKPASQQDILTVHSREYVDLIKNAKAGSYLDGDTPAPETIYEYALLSAGSALLAAQKHSFSLMRPPGHHAGRNGRAMGASTLGFCYFNNIAVAVKKLDLPTLILDIDGHHGNGTQEVFQEDPKVTFISLHKHPTYPGTGLTSQGNCLNFPMPYSTGNSLYLKTLEQALSKVELSNIEVVAFSAGFDAHQGDLASLGLTHEGYREIGRKVGALGKPVFGVLEGGYIGEYIGKDLDELISGIEENQ
ncbi:MAG: histone deacetylase [Candidatus Bathyarchaeota archaeon]|nr:histone deacetylase [Candidatus Bathyarchaeota archaeon]